MKKKSLNWTRQELEILELKKLLRIIEVDRNYQKQSALTQQRRAEAAEEVIKRAQESENRVRGNHQNLVNEIKNIYEFLHEIPTTESCTERLQRMIGIAQGHLYVIVAQTKPVFNKVSEYIREQERQKNRIMNDQVDALLYGMDGKKP